MTKSEVSWSEINAAIQVNPYRANLGGGAATSSLTSLPDDTPLSWLPGWSEDHSAPIPDCISLALWLRDPLYRSATESVRGLMEMEEASFLLNNIDIAWKAQNGRVHGWVRKHLEEDLRARSGGAAALVDSWDLVRQQKRQAQLVDYICTMRNFRVGLWWPEQRAVTNIPAQPNVETLVLIHCETNRVLIGSTIELPLNQWSTIITKADMEWFIPACASSIGASTVPQIVEQLQSIKSGIYKGNRNTLWKQLQFEKAIRTVSSPVA
jgi:hypothetical protein